MTAREMFLEMLDYSLFNHLTCLLVRDSSVEFIYHERIRFCSIMMYFCVVKDKKSKVSMLC